MTQTVFILGCCLLGVSILMRIQHGGSRWYFVMALAALMMMPLLFVAFIAF